MTNQNPNPTEPAAAANMIAEAKIAFRRAREEGRKAVDEAWAPAIDAVEHRLEVVREALNEPGVPPEASEVLTRQLVVLAESLGRCRASRSAGYAQADTTAMASLRGLIPTSPALQGGAPNVAAQLAERIGAAARGLGTVPVIPRPAAVPPEGQP